MWNKLSEIEDHDYSSTNDRRFQNGVISIFHCVAGRRSFKTAALELLDAIIKAFNRYFSRETKKEKAFQWHLFNNRDRQLQKASRNWECYRNRPRRIRDSRIRKLVIRTNNSWRSRQWKYIGQHIENESRLWVRLLKKTSEESATNLLLQENIPTEKSKWNGNQIANCRVGTKSQIKYIASQIW